MLGEPPEVRAICHGAALYGLDEFVRGHHRRVEVTDQPLQYFRVVRQILRVEFRREFVAHVLSHGWIGEKDSVDRAGCRRSWSPSTRGSAEERAVVQDLPDFEVVSRYREPNLNSTHDS